jgi:hypothetical protein
MVWLVSATAPAPAVRRRFGLHADRTPGRAFRSLDFDQGVVDRRGPEDWVLVALSVGEKCVAISFSWRSSARVSPPAYPMTRPTRRSFAAAYNDLPPAARQSDRGGQAGRSQRPTTRGVVAGVIKWLKIRAGPFSGQWAPRNSRGLTVVCGQVDGRIRPAAMSGCRPSSACSWKAARPTLSSSASASGRERPKYVALPR